MQAIIHFGTPLHTMQLPLFQLLDPKPDRSIAILKSVISLFSFAHLGLLLI